MAHMSYCRFQNTLKDLRDCHDEIGNEDLSPEEDMARKKLIKLCQDIIADAEFNGLIEEDNEE